MLASTERGSVCSSGEDDDVGRPAAGRAPSRGARASSISASPTGCRASTGRSCPPGRAGIGRRRRPPPTTPARRARRRRPGPARSGGAARGRCTPMVATAEGASPVRSGRRVSCSRIVTEPGTSRDEEGRVRPAHVAACREDRGTSHLDRRRRPERRGARAAAGDPRAARALGRGQPALGPAIEGRVLHRVRLRRRARGAARRDDDLIDSELHLFAGERFYLLTIRREPLFELEGSRRARRPGPSPRRGRGSGSTSTCCSTRSSTATSTWSKSSRTVPTTSRRAVFEDEAADGLQERIFRLKRRTVRFRRAVSPLREVIDLLHERGDVVTPPLAPYYRDVLDHVDPLARVDRQHPRAADDRARGSAGAGVQPANVVMKQLSAWAGIILVPTLIAGIYGMNFRDMPELSWRLGYPIALGMMVDRRGAVVPRVPPAGLVVAMCRALKVLCVASGSTRRSGVEGGGGLRRMGADAGRDVSGGGAPQTPRGASARGRGVRALRRLHHARARRLPRAPGGGGPRGARGDASSSPTSRRFGMRCLGVNGRDRSAERSPACGPARRGRTPRPWVRSGAAAPRGPRVRPGRHPDRDDDVRSPVVDGTIGLTVVVGSGRPVAGGLLEEPAYPPGL